jgi:hypothetical protein
MPRCGLVHRASVHRRKAAKMMCPNVGVNLALIPNMLILPDTRQATQGIYLESSAAMSASRLERPRARFPACVGQQPGRIRTTGSGA